MLPEHWHISCAHLLIKLYNNNRKKTMKAKTVRSRWRQLGARAWQGTGHHCSSQPAAHSPGSHVFLQAVTQFPAWHSSHGVACVGLLALRFDAFDNFLWGQWSDLENLPLWTKDPVLKQDAQPSQWTFHSCFSFAASFDPLLKKSSHPLGRASGNKLFCESGRWCAWRQTMLSTTAVMVDVFWKPEKGTAPLSGSSG